MAVFFDKSRIMFTDGVFEGWIFRINLGMTIHFDA